MNDLTPHLTMKNSFSRILSEEEKPHWLFAHLMKEPKPQLSLDYWVKHYAPRIVAPEPTAKNPYFEVDFFYPNSPKRGIRKLLLKIKGAL